MRRSPLPMLGVLLLLPLAACASTTTAADEPSTPTSTPDPLAAELAVAQVQAQEWADAAVVPPEAVPVADKPGNFQSYYGWPCQPVAEVEVYWTLSDTTVAEAVNWLGSHPTADLVSTAAGPPLADDPMIDAASIGYIPADGSQQGIVYTVAKMDEGIAIRAEVAALTESAECPVGENLGKPGQG